jgi:enhancer of polycomb-like protein
VVQRPPPPSALRLTTLRQDGRGPAETTDLVQLSDRLAEKEHELLADIEKKVQNHKEWNKNHVDLTRGPLSPIKGRTTVQRFRPATTQYLITPPNSASSESNDEPDPMDLDSPNPRPVFEFKGLSAQENTTTTSPAYRRRIGRLNRLWIDRRGFVQASQTGGLSDRWKYDQDSDSDDDQPMYEVDPFDTRALRFRASIPLPQGWLGMRQAVPPVKGVAAPSELAAGATRPALPMAQPAQAPQSQVQNGT